MKNSWIAVFLVVLGTSSGVRADAEAPSEKCVNTISAVTNAVYSANFSGIPTNPVSTVGKLIRKKFNLRTYAVSAHNESENPWLDVLEKYTVQVSDSGNGSCSIVALKVLPPS